MNPETWRKAQRNHFPYNTELEYIVGIPLIAPLAFLVFDLAIVQRYLNGLKTVIQTIAVSVAAFWITDKMIDAFKDSLEKKGLFGRDLNKAGIQKDKKPV